MVGYVDEINSVNARVCRCHTECELLPALAVAGTSGVTADTVEFTCVMTAAMVVVRISLRTDILLPFFCGCLRWDPLVGYRLQLYFVLNIQRVLPLCSGKK